MAIKIATPKAPHAPILPKGIAPEVTLLMQQYPKIGEKIIMLWGSEELQKYLSDIIVDERGDRQGFPPKIAATLMHIFKYHSKLVPEGKVVGHVWHQTPKK